MAISYYRGPDTYVIYGEETSYGAGGAPSASNRIGKVQNVSWTAVNNMFRVQGLGEGNNATAAVLGAFDISGSLDFDVNDFTFLQYGFGEVGGAGAIADPYEISECDRIGYSSGETPSLALEIGSEGGSNDDVTTITGVVFGTTTLNCTQGEKLSATMDFIAQKPTTSTSLETYTASASKVFVFQQGNVTVGTDTLQCTSFSLSTANNIQSYRDIGSRFIVQPTKGVRRYDYSITLRKKFDDTASVLSATELRSYFFGASTTPATGGTTTAYAVSLDITEGAASGDRVVNIDLENGYFENWSEPIPLEGGVIEITVTGFALAGLTDGAVKVPIRWYTIA